MADPVTNELLYEVLKQMQADIVHIRRRADEHHEQFKVVRQLLLAMQGDGMRYETMIAGVRADVDSIKRRLNLSDA